MQIALWPLLVVLLAASCIFLRHWILNVEPRQVEITRQDVFFPNLPPELDGITLCQVSDVHITAERRNADEIAAAIRSVRADLYLFTGDLIYRQSGIPAFFAWFASLGDAVRPCIVVLGNAEHKRWFDSSPLVTGLASRRVPVLNNAIHCFRYGDGLLQVVGVDDPHTDFDDFAKAYAGADPEMWTLLLSHSPEGAARLGGRRADLILAGHTHGGQVRLPVVGALVTGTKRVRRLVMGWYSGEELRRRSRGDVGNARLYVSRGLGMSRFAGRLLCRPELAVFTLRRGGG